MSSDPRDRPLHPTAEEIDAWAVREQRRRAAWLTGPSEEEKRIWAQRYRWRAALGLEESRLGPSPEEVQEWAEREHRRRSAWPAGPTDAEKQAWRTRQSKTGEEESEADADAWAERETKRRQDWVAGPTEQEKQEWARRQSTSVLEELMNLPAVLDAEFPEPAQRFLRNVELAGKGTLHTLTRAPQALWSYFIRAGRAFEKEMDEDTPRRRVKY